MSRKCYIRLTRLGMYLATAITAGLTLFLAGYVLAKGIPALSWNFLTTKPSYLSGNIGILPDILNTLYIVIATLIIVIPLGMGAAVYLTEYASNRKLVGVIEYAAEALYSVTEHCEREVMQERHTAAAGCTEQKCRAVLPRDLC